MSKYKCDYNDISLYFSQELDSQRAIELVAHLDDCPICKEYLQQQIRVLKYLSDNQITPPKQLNKQVLRASGIKQRTGSRKLYYYLTAVAAVVATIVLVRITPPREQYHSMLLDIRGEISIVENYNEQIALLESSLDESKSDYIEFEESLNLIDLSNRY